MTEHTKEPWTYDAGDVGADYSHRYLDVYVDIDSDGAILIAHVNYAIGPAGLANARRIVACVNACAGISTERLEDGTLGQFLDSMEITSVGIHFNKPHGTTKALLAKLKDPSK